MAPDTSGGTSSYSYDQASRLTQVTATTSAPLLATVATGDNQSLALKSDGTVWAWGRNASGQLGNNSTTNSSVPVQVNTLTSVIGVAAGGADSMAVKSDGTAWDWGYNGFGQLGNNTTTDSHVPVQVSGLTGTVAVAAGDGHALALRSDGTVWAWGDNTSGQLGNNSHTNQSTPVQVSGLTNVVAIAAGDDHSLALKSDGTVWAWGDNEAGALGNNSTTNSLVPIQVPGMTGVVSIAGGDTHTVAVKSDGTVWAWGSNGSGQLGNNSTTRSLVPVQVSGLTGAVSVTAGGHNSMALKSNGTAWAWGDNSVGQLGNNSTINSSVPVQVSGLTASGPIAINGDDDDHALAVKSDGTVWAWGSNTNGQLGNNSTTNSHVAIQSNMANVKVSSSSTHATYAYNGDGLRMAKTVSGTVTQETWDSSGRLLVDGVTNYVYGPGGLPLEQVGSSGTLFYYQDQLGSTRALATITGTVVAAYTYNSYGKLIGSAVTGTVSNSFGYAGQYTDAESGLIYLRARYYDPATGQFLSRDPLGAVTGEPYAYAAANPLNGTDPTGLITVGLCGGGNVEVLGFLNAGADGCLDQTLNGHQIGVVGTAFGPGGVGDGAALFGGAYVQVSNATTLGQLRGKFMYAAVTLDAEAGVQGVVFWNQSFTVVGFELGIGVGGGASLAGGFSDTGVHTLGGIPAMLAHAFLNASLPPLSISSLLQQAWQFVTCG